MAKKKKGVDKIGREVPQSLKFGMVVAVAIFWADVLRESLKAVLEISPMRPALEVNLILAVVMTLLGYGVLVGYRRLLRLAKKIKI